MKRLSCLLSVFLVAMLPTVSHAVPIRITDGLVGEWKTSSRMFTYDLVVDTSGFARHGRAYGGRISSHGWWDRGFDLRGDRYVQVPNSANLNFGTGSFTLAAWVKVTNPETAARILIENYSFSGRGYMFGVSSGRLSLRLSDETGEEYYFSDVGFMGSGRWHHVAVSVNRTQWPVHIAFYIDGHQVGFATPKMGNIDNLSNPFMIGADPGGVLAGLRFNDRVDEVLVYNRALPNWEIWNVLNPGRPSFEPWYWNGNDRQGSNNCYNYANNKATNTFAQPGRANGLSFSLTCDSVRLAAIADGLEPIPDYPSTLLNFKTGVALVVAPGYDYHWYRLDENGMWTHKAGGTPATQFDNSGNLISDPRTANRGIYTQFCGFFTLWSDIAQGYGHEYVQ